jgi:hypothetical protein
MRPVLVAGVERLLDQQPAKAGAVDEQIRLDLRAIVQVQRADEAILGAQLHAQHLALDARDAARLGVGTQILRIQAGIEMQRVGEARQDQARILGGSAESAQARRRPRERVVEQRLLDACGAQPQPVLVQATCPIGVPYLPNG